MGAMLFMLWPCQSKVSKVVRLPMNFKVQRLQKAVSGDQGVGKRLHLAGSHGTCGAFEASWRSGWHQTGAKIALLTFFLPRESLTQVFFYSRVALLTFFGSQKAPLMDSGAARGDSLA